MEMSQLEALLGRARVEGHPTRSFLARIHRGDAFTRIFAMALILFVWIQGLLFGFFWTVSWSQIYYEFERWELVLAFVDQFFLLGLMCVLLHVTYLRAGHLRRIPPGHFVSLQATALILRWLGECVLILTLGALGHALLGVPEPGWVSSALLGVGLSAPEEDLKAGAKAWSLFSGGWLQILGFFAFTFFYALASAIDAFLAIERNTRDEKRTFATGGEVVGRGHEVRAPQETVMASI